jgi:hypothetical protein
MPLKLKGHKTGRMKALFMEFQQETHENIPAQTIPTGKPQEHSCWGGSSRELQRRLVRGGGMEERTCLTPR